MNPTPPLIHAARALIPAQRPKRWRVTLAVVDTPGPGEDYLSKDDLLDNVLKRKAHAGVAVIEEHAEEDPIPVGALPPIEPAPDDELFVAWPAADPEPVPPIVRPKFSWWWKR